ncbi:MAG TPA: hypothetical protein VLA44_01730 [Clostridia bacterium]|nr:hypothetical protein [Clostridia bacterium]
MTPTEYKLLYHLVRNAGHVLTHGTLLTRRTSASSAAWATASSRRTEPGCKRSATRPRSLPGVCKVRGTTVAACESHQHGP